MPLLTDQQMIQLGLGLGGKRDICWNHVMGKCNNYNCRCGIGAHLMSQQLTECQVEYAYCTFVDEMDKTSAQMGK